MSVESFLDYLKNLFANRTFGLSEIHYPQTVQHFLLLNFGGTFFSFLAILAGIFCSLGAFFFFRAYKKNLAGEFSELSVFLRMKEESVKRQASAAAVSTFLKFCGVAAPIIFLITVVWEYSSGGGEVGGGLGGVLKTALENGDKNLFFGGAIAAAFTTFVIASPLAGTAIHRGLDVRSVLGGFFRKKWR